MQAYPEDLESDFVEEFLQFSKTLSDDFNIIQMTEYFYNRASLILGTYLNVIVALRKYLTINFISGEKSFKKLYETKSCQLFSFNVNWEWSFKKN